ncbi:MAG: DUF2147 domain-containing protein [Treponema sp.]|jgi:uncharacterized protein (DUF2147 family)|nr:DUF2147 domain-containing protein [Treponema sp.]
MKKIAFFICTILLGVVFASGFCFAADPVEGFWISLDDKNGKATAGWEIYTTGNKLYGKILSVADHPQDVLADKCRDSYRGFPVSGKVNTMRVVGTPWIFDLAMDRIGVWSGGQVIDPDNGSMYRCRITFRAMDGNRYKTDVLEVRGEIGLGIGRSQYWRKCSREEAMAVR